MSKDKEHVYETLRLGSDVSSELSCSLCAHQDNNVVAIKHCVECSENLCSDCLTFHSNFAEMKVHQIRDKLSYQTRKNLELPTQRCNRHGWMLVDRYCPVHDVVGCSVCTTEVHSSCESIKFVPNIAKMMQFSEETAAVETKMNHILDQLNQSKQQKKLNLKLLQPETNRLLKSVKSLRSKVNDKLDRMEKRLVHKIYSELGERRDGIYKDIDIINNEKVALEQTQKALKRSEKVNRSELFVQLKNANSFLQEQENVLKGLHDESECITMTLIPSTDIQRLLDNENIALGHMSERFYPKSTAYFTDISVSLSSDTKISNIADMCLTADGDLILTDWSNDCIKKLDESYVVVEHLKMPSSPGGICVAERNSLAVTLVNEKKVQFVFQKPLTFGSSFQVGDHCRGIECHNGQLYVCCGGWIAKGESQGRIEVYSIEGDLLRSYYQGAHWPCYVKVSGKQDLLISNEGRAGLTVLKMHENTVMSMPVKDSLYPSGLCRLGDSQLCVAGYRSNNVVLMSEDEDCQQELLTEKDGISQPHALCFDKKRSRLIVSLDKSDTIKIFNIFF